MIFSLQFGLKKHLQILSQYLLVFIYYKLHSKSCDYLHKLTLVYCPALLIWLVLSKCGLVAFGVQEMISKSFCCSRYYPFWGKFIGKKRCQDASARYVTTLVCWLLSFRVLSWHSGISWITINRISPESFHGINDWFKLPFKFGMFADCRIFVDIYGSLWELWVSDYCLQGARSRCFR